jgi:predicted nucleotide-binding protein
MENEQEKTPAIEALETIEDIANELQIISEELLSSPENTSIAFEKLRRWKRRALQRMQNKVSAEEAENFQKAHEPIIMGDPLRSLTLSVENYTAFLQALHADIKDHPETILEQRLIDSWRKEFPRRPEVMPVNSKKVFIVHGHDEANLLHTRDLLKDRFKLQPIILKTEAGKGRTIIEKFEDEAKDAVYAFVLLTPDDLIKTTNGEYSQARPNVIFELGWFYGKLGRKNVCILFKKGTKIHSDLDGIERIEFSNHVDEAYLAIERELTGGGII